MEQEHSAKNQTLPYVSSLQTAKGLVRIVTGLRLPLFFKNPHTSVIPRGYWNAQNEGITFAWKTDDPTILASLHDSIVQLVEMIGATKVFKFGVVVTAEMQSSKLDISQTVESLRREDFDFPLSALVLLHFKRFE